jgi:hypothetical protein
MSDSPWFLLYGRTSVDGRGSANYEGRTTLKEVALRHFQQMDLNPYSVGHVVKVTDSSFKRVLAAEEIS